MIKITISILILSLSIFSAFALAIPKNKYDQNKKMHGRWKLYWDDEQKVKMSSGRFKHGKPIGVWKYYNNKGQIEKIEKIKRQKGLIRTKMYHTNGKLNKQGLARTLMVDNELIYYWFGEWKCYDTKGDFVGIEVYDNGILIEED